MKIKLKDKRWTVWVGGVEVNDHYLTAYEADLLSDKYVDMGYDDVVIEELYLKQ